MNNCSIYSHNAPMPREQFSQLFRIMEYSFPVTERGSEAMHYSEFDRPEFRCLCYEPDGIPEAFLNYFDFAEDNIIFVEHFAVAKELRGQGIGSVLMSYLKEITFPSLIVLEVEPPDGETERRRISFYQRLGFYLNDGSYFQPEYYGRSPAIPLRLMTTEPLDTDAFVKVRSLIYKKVYKK